MVIWKWPPAFGTFLSRASVWHNCLLTACLLESQANSNKTVTKKWMEHNNINECNARHVAKLPQRHLNRIVKRIKRSATRFNMVQRETTLMVIKRDANYLVQFYLFIFSLLSPPTSCPPWFFQRFLSVKREAFFLLSPNICSKRFVWLLGFVLL